MPTASLHLSVFYLIRPYVRSEVVEDEEDGAADYDNLGESKKVSALGALDIFVDLFGTGPEAKKALSSDKGEQREMLRDLRSVSSY